MPSGITCVAFSIEALNDLSICINRYEWAFRVKTRDLDGELNKSKLDMRLK